MRSFGFILLMFVCCAHGEVMHDFHLGENCAELAKDIRNKISSQLYEEPTTTTLIWEAGGSKNTVSLDCNNGALKEVLMISTQMSEQKALEVYRERHIFLSKIYGSAAWDNENTSDSAVSEGLKKGMIDDSNKYYAKWNNGAQVISLFNIKMHDGWAITYTLMPNSSDNGTKIP